MRFATGQSFIASYCNVRKKKGIKELVKKNTVFYFEYTSTLREIRDSLIRIEMDFAKAGDCTLEQIRDAYYLKTGKSKDKSLITVKEAFDAFVSDSKSDWSEGTKDHFISTQNHLIEFEKTYGELTLSNLNENFWNSLRDDYFVKVKKFSNSTTNKNLKKLKQFLKYASKRPKDNPYIKHKIDFDELTFLDEIEPFKIALKFLEVEKLINLDLSAEPRLERVRDLFALEILTGQRFSDLPKVLDRKHFSDTNIQIYQQKTGEKVSIPLHPKLKTHLEYIFNKYPEGLPVISNNKFNIYLKEVCVEAKFNKQHSWVTLTGKKKISQTDFRHNLITSHTGRRTFCTLALESGINAEKIMKVTGHRTYDQFREYVKVDDADLDKAFEGMFIDKKEKVI